MSEKRRAPQKKRGGFLPALCNVLGALILLSVLLAVVPVTVPRLLGYQLYHVLSGSMEPEIPVGSLLYVSPAPAEEIREGEIIAFSEAGSVITHRVVKNRLVEGEFVTKGDANAGEDLNAVPYQRLIGRVVCHIPVLGEMMSLLTSGIGKAYAVCYAACGVMLNLLAGRIRENRRSGNGEESA